MRALSLLIMIALVGGIFVDAERTNQITPEITETEIVHNVAIELPNTPAIPAEETDFSALFEKMVAEEQESDTKTLKSDNVDFLQKVFEKTRDPQIITPTLQAMVEVYQFISAKQFIEKLTPAEIKNIDPVLHLQIAFNSFPLSSSSAFSSLEALVENYKQTNAINLDQANRYQGIIALMQRKYDTFFQISAQFQNASYKQFANKIASLKKQIAQQEDMPSYYFDALVAVELFQQGFFQPAKILALYAHSKESKYILPYQVLAYANFLTASREASVEYLTTLSSLDPTQQEKYTFLMGVAYYRNQQYETSVMKLSQIQKADYRLDVARYLTLNYSHLQQTSKLITTRQKLLGYAELKPADFFNYFYKVFFSPYIQGEAFTLYQQNPELAQNYLIVCASLLSTQDTTICEYGKVGLALATQNSFGLEESLLSLIKTSPQGYLYHALGEYYTKVGRSDEAKVYLLKAIGMTDSINETDQIKTLLQKIL
ncbi:MAG: hypothetical protein LBO09_03225 [Candidatus Peribacteria bacterium]|nr:hypothetical protein [Candidatus Peribacteria bacterium]